MSSIAGQLGQPTRPRNAEAASEQPTILIVDDVPENLALLAEILRPAYRVRAARSGERVLEIVADGPLPDLILLDIMMPGIPFPEARAMIEAQRGRHFDPEVMDAFVATFTNFRAIAERYRDADALPGAVPERAAAA